MTRPSRSPVVATVDYERDGVQHGVLQVPYSWDRDAYGHIPIPIMVARNGDGPTVLLTGANHGDEYEGPIALMRLMRRLRIERLRGRLIVIPALNFPAYLNGTRTSPLDRGNLNRLFPGDPAGGPTSVIAHYVESELMPRCDYLLDLHAAGSTANYLPMLFLKRPATPEQHQKTEWAIQAFGAPRVMFMESLENEQMIGSVARKHDVFFMTGEFGGAGMVSLDGVGIVERGIAGLLDALGMLEAEQPLPRGISKRYVFKREHFIFAPVPGIFEPAFRLGDEVAPGQLAGYVHDPHRPWAEPAEVRFEGGGLAVNIRTSALVQAGNCLGHLAQEEA